MNAQMNDWRGEQLIRAPKREHQPAPKENHNERLGRLRIEDLAKIRQAVEAGINSLTAISLETGLAEGRVYSLCRANNIKTVSAQGNNWKKPE